MSVSLLDVNVLVSLLDSAHVHHSAAVRWFAAVASVNGWATCAITENGFIRIVSSLSYPNLRLTPALASESLSRFRQSFSGLHHFWQDEISLTENSRFDLSLLTGHRQISDVYLAGLAHRNGGRLATLDSAIPWRAVRGAEVSLVDRIPV